MLEYRDDCDPGECESFELVIEKITDVNEGKVRNVVEKSDELAIYFRNTNIENAIANNKPPFRIGMWN